MKGQVGLLILMLIFVGSCTAAKVDNIRKATSHYKMGVSHLSENNIHPAFIEFWKAYELNPNDKEVLNAIGIIYLLHYNDYQKAIDFFQKAIAIDKDFSEAHNNLGFAYESVKRFNDAIDSYKKALSNRLYRTPEKAYNSLGRVYYRLGRYNEAIDAYKDALKRMPNLHFAYYGLALCYNAKGRYGEASTAITKAIELDPLFNGDKNKAINEFKRRLLTAKGEDEKDISDWLEILKY